ncbi:eCIS core domain-containing protein [Nostoc sp. WHI]|uniref:eCIS core domain-containing protein n=1 Tax=Nostoc sp. WHI TaxID=2650611 RepID=UPI0018C64A3F
MTSNSKSPSILIYFPSVEHDGLTSGLLDTATHPLRESSFKHDFSKIPVRTTTAPLIQAKPMVGEPGDIHQQEADQVASQVVKSTADEDKPKPPQVRGRLITTTAEEEKKKLIAKQKVPQKQEEGKVQKQAQPGQMPIIAPAVENRLKTSQGGGQPLPEPTRELMESRFHHNFSKVRVHNDPEAAQSLNARAFTHRNNIVFNAAQYQPEVHEGQRLLAHELTHVVQQGAAPVKPTYESQ